MKQFFQLLVVFVVVVSGQVFAEGRVEDLLFTVECGDGSRGSAFLMKDAVGVWMVSNCHVICGKNNVSFINMCNQDQTFSLPEVLQIAEAADAVRFKIDGIEDGFLLTDDCDFDEEVFSFGNSGGVGVVTKSKGTVLGKGIRDVEVSCDIIPGNSGGPVLNAEDQVIGISSYIIKPPAMEVPEALLSIMSSHERKQIEEGLKEVKGTRFEDTRRFAISMSDIHWQDVTREIFTQESKEFELQKQAYGNLRTLVSKAVNGMVTIPEESGEPFVRKRWVRRYNKDVPGELSSFLGAIYLKSQSPDSFYRSYGRVLLDLCEEAEESISDQQQEQDSLFTVSYFKKELTEQAEQSQLVLKMVGSVAEVYKER